jgi:hypothetical protein
MATAGLALGACGLALSIIMTIVLFLLPAGASVQTPR